MKRDGSNPQNGERKCAPDLDKPCYPRSGPPRSKIVRFATVCVCGKRSDEYTSWPTCHDCGEYICPNCQKPGTDTEDERNEALCKVKCIEMPMLKFIYDEPEEGTPTVGVVYHVVWQSDIFKLTGHKPLGYVIEDTPSTIKDSPRPVDKGSK